MENQRHPHQRHMNESSRDLSNKPAPKVLLVFEGAVGFCTDSKRFERMMKKEKWAPAMECWQPNELMIRRILYLFHKKNITFEVVTFLPDRFAAHLREWLDDLDVPIHRVWSSTPDKLARALSYMPDVLHVYDPDPSRFMRYGSKGSWLQDINQIAAPYFKEPSNERV